MMNNDASFFLSRCSHCLQVTVPNNMHLCMQYMCAPKYVQACLVPNMLKGIQGH